MFCNNRKYTQQLIVGSVKANLGHTESISGLAGIIKTILVLENGVIPPNPTFSQPREDLNLTKSGIHVPTRLLEWPSGFARRASVNSNGYGGTPAHIILEVLAASPSASTTVTPNGRRKNMAANRPLLFVLSHKRDGGLVKAAQRLSSFLSDPDRDENKLILDNLAFTLGVKRSHHLYRASIVASSTNELLRGLDSITVGVDRPMKAIARPKVCYAFTGIFHLTNQ